MHGTFYRLVWISVDLPHLGFSLTWRGIEKPHGYTSLANSMPSTSLFVYALSIMLNGRKRQ